MIIKKGDNVVIRTGKDRGKKGKVVKALPDHDAVIVEGINLKKRHQKPKKQGKKGEIITKAAPLNASNAMLFCATCGKGTRAGHRITGDKKVRICAKCKNEI